VNPSRLTFRGAMLCAVALAVLGGLSACGNPLKNSAPRSEYFVLRDLAPSPATSPATSATPAAASAGSSVLAAPALAAGTSRVLMIAAGPTPTLFDSERMVFSPDGVSRAYYHFANWSERPARSLVQLTEARLAQDPAWKSVVSTVAGVRGDLLLTLKIDDLTHDDSKQPGTVRIAVTAELLDWRQRRLVQRRPFERNVSVEARNAAGAAAAANRAVTLLLDDLGAWTREAAVSVQK